MNRHLSKYLVSMKYHDCTEQLAGQLKILGQPVRGELSGLILTDAETDEYYHLLKHFIAFIDQAKQSDNPFNGSGVRETLCRQYGVLRHEEWSCYAEFERAKGHVLSAGRSNSVEQPEYVIAQYRLFVLCGIPDNPSKSILLDRKGRILDGVQRLGALRALVKHPFISTTVDYEHPIDKY